jgi:phage portal protein BeeE
MLFGLFKKRKATNSLNGSGYRFMMGGSTSGKHVNERSAMQMTAVYACVRILSESIASLPVHLYQNETEGSKVRAVKHPLYRILHTATRCRIPMRTQERPAM